MGRILHFDCFSGAAGDMILGAMLDAGLPAAVLRDAIAPLALGVELRVGPVTRGGLRATRFEVVLPPALRPEASAQPHRHLAELLALVDRAAVSPAVRQQANAMLRRLAEIEADVHGMPVEHVHLHEVGATDSLVDILGAAVAFEWFGTDQISCSPVNVGSGTVRTAHGVLPVPAPATARLMLGRPIYAEPGGPARELLTPTGALLLTSYARTFGAMPPMRPLAVGHGAGEADVPGRPNVVRLLVGEPIEPGREGGHEETVVVLECEVDDVSPQVLGAFIDRGLAAGAFDVFLTPVVMKKQRPGTLVTVLAPPALRGALTDLVFHELPTLGVRYHETRRHCLAREHVPVETPFGRVRMKVGRRDRVVVTAAPEFDDCLRLAADHAVAVREVMAAAISAWRAARPDPDRPAA